MSTNLFSYFTLFFQKMCVELLCPRMAVPENGACREIAKLNKIKLFHIKLKVYTFTVLKTKSLLRRLGRTILRHFFGNWTICSDWAYVLSDNVAILDFGLEITSQISEDTVFQMLKRLSNSNGLQTTFEGDTFSIFKIMLTDENTDGLQGEILSYECLYKGINVDKTWLYTCPYIDINLQSLASSGVSDDVISDVRAKALHTKIGSVSICKETYMELYVANSSTFITKQLYTCVLFVLILTNVLFKGA